MLFKRKVDEEAAEPGANLGVENKFSRGKQ